MHVNLPLDKTNRMSAKPPAPAAAGKAPTGNFGDLLKSAQATAAPAPNAASAVPGTPAAPSSAA